MNAFSALLRRDLLLIFHNCWPYLLLALLGICMQNRFFVAYPAMLLAITPITLVQSDQVQHWDAMEAAFPIPRSIGVSVKYLLGLVMGGVYVLIYGLLALALGGDLEEVFLLLIPLVLAMLISLSTCLPVYYRFQAVAARTISIFFTIAIYTFLATFSTFTAVGGAVVAGMEVWISLGVCLLLLAGSWRLSIHFAKNQEI